MARDGRRELTCFPGLRVVLACMTGYGPSWQILVPDEKRLTRRPMCQKEQQSDDQPMAVLEG
jgi:hypothetical protein